VVPAGAHADGAAAVRDCTDDGVLNKTYTSKELTDALAHLPADIDEYSDCRNVLRRAQLAAIPAGNSSAGGTSTSGGSSTASRAGGGTTGGGTGGGTGGRMASRAGGGTSGGGTASRAGGGTSGGGTASRAGGGTSGHDGSPPAALDGRPVSASRPAGTGLGDLPTPLLVLLALLAVAGLAAAGLGTRRLVHGRRRN
jgi:hypothetical protein